MKDISTENFTNMQSAAGLQIEQNFKTNFYFKRELPDNLKFLDVLSWNFYWSWQPEAVNLYRELDARLWEKCEQNPRLFLKQIGGLQLWQKANDIKFVEKLKAFAAKYENYLSQKPHSFGKITSQNPVAYFCAEYGVHNSLPIY